MTDYTYNTGNPIGSTDVRDGVDNLKSFDVLLNSTDDTYQDRLGNTVPTAAGAIKALGPVPVNFTFTTGGTFTSRNQAAKNPPDGNWYGWGGDGFPHDVAPGTDPTLPGSGYVPRTDVVLRSDLAANGGASLIGSASGETVQESIDDVLPLRSNELSAASIARAIANGTAQKCSCYGDSTMYGYKVGMPLPTDQVATPPTAAFQSIMSELQLPLTIYNRAISSTTLQSMIDGTDGSGSTFAAKVNVGGVDHDANIVYCNHAVNDAKANSDIKVYRENLITFITLCRKNGIVPVLVTPNPNPPIYSMTEENSRRLVFFAETMRAVAREYTVDIVDQYSYFDKSQKVTRMIDMVPDGIHPSDAMYIRAGKNLAIPVLSPLVVDGSQSSVKGLTGVSYKDNLTGRSMQGLGGRVGLTLTATRGAQPQALHIPVLFPDAATGFSLYGSESAGEDKVNVLLNSFNLGSFTDTKIHGDLAYVDNDYRTLRKVSVYAGLQLVTLAYDAVAAPGSRFTFSGIGPIPEQIQQATNNTNGGVSKLTPICSGYTVLTTAKLYGTNEVVFSDKNNSPVVKIKNVANVFTVEIVANGSVLESHTASGFLSDGTYQIEMAVSESSVAVSAGDSGILIPIARKLPAIFLYTKALNCYVI